MNYEETLSTLKAIQASYAPVPFLANSETEPRFVIDSDTREIIIPEEFKFLAVKMDHMSEKIYFEIPRYFDDEDLATKICVVQYINTNGDVPIEAIVAAVDVDTESEAGKIIFRWDVDNYLTRYAGVVSFAVRFYTISDDNRFTYSWNTLPATLPVLDTLDNTNDTVSQNYPTELVQWQFRMSELDRTITDKINSATASIDADVKAAQAARKGAEDAEARVNAIVAGNEAYTKQQSHDLFALALRGSAEAAKSITIYPDKGSNVVATIKGFTKQAGTGDPSPSNVRQLTNGGLKLVAVTFDGSDDENWQLNSGSTAGASGSKRFSIVVDVAVNNTSYTAKPDGYCNRLTGNTPNNTNSGYSGDDVYSVLSASGSSYVQIRLAGISTVDVLRAALAADPVIVWYQPADESQATGLYAPLIGTGNDHTGACGKLTAKLCQGDILITKVKSGCDKVVTFDGSEDENWALAFQNNGFYIRTPDACQPPNSITLTGGIKSNYLSEITSNNIYYAQAYGIALYNESPYICVRIQGVSTVSALKEYLSTNPLTVWYRSTNYTDSADIPVSLEAHQRAVLVPDGTENWKPYGTAPSVVNHKAYILKTPSTVDSEDGGKQIICTIAPTKKAGTAYATDDNAAVSFASGNVLLQLNTDIADTLGAFKSYLTAQYAVGTPVTIVYELATPITYAHDPVDFIADPDEEGAWVITGEADGTVSAEYNKNITKALEDILTRVSALELHALGG